MEKKQDSKETKEIDGKAETKEIGEVKESLEVKDDIKKEEKNEEINKKDNKKIYIIIAVIAITIAILSTGFALANANNENIIAGVTIDGLNVQGLNKDEAKRLVENKIEEKINKEIKVKINEEEQTILLSQMELIYDVEQAVEEAFEIGRQNNIFVNNFEILKSKFVGNNVNIEVQYNEELLNNIIQNIKNNIPNAVVQPTYCIENEELIITRGAAGFTLDDVKVKNEIVKNINLAYFEDINVSLIYSEPEDIDIEKIYEEVYTEAKDAYYTTDPFKVYAEVMGIDFNLEEAKEILKEQKQEYIINLTITKPKKTTSDIGTEAFPDMLSTFSTRYDASNVSRTTNLRLALSKINGVVLMPGDTFSYNKTLGKRTVEAGYKDAGGYSGGKVVQMLGGGICQISSTLYDAVVYANLDIVERHNHAFLTSYVGAGKDATVVYGSLDFKFKNSRNYPIKIQAYLQNGIATVSIYGIKEENEYDIEISTTILNYIPYNVIYEDDANLEEGKEKVTQYGQKGCKSITYKILKQNGREISRTVLSTDTYSAMNKYIKRGTKVTTIVEPTIPEEPTAPEKPEMPENPEVPEEPATPSVPIIPEKPETPEAPDEPEVPEEPEKPETPETPDGPEVPEEAEGTKEEAVA